MDSIADLWGTFLAHLHAKFGYDFWLIASDASRSSNRVAAAAVWSGGGSGVRLPDDLSVTAAELAGIDLALDAVRAKAVSEHVVLLCDSRSALQIIAGPKDDMLRGYFLQKILALRATTGKQVHLVWVPSHVATGTSLCFL